MTGEGGRSELTLKWTEYHLKSLECKTEEDEGEFCTWFNLDIKHFICKDCRPHAQDLLRLNPIEKYRGIRDQNGRLIGLFKYTHLFHNLVNRRLGKQTMMYEDALTKYLKLLTDCSQVCVGTSRPKREIEQKQKSGNSSSSILSSVSTTRSSTSIFVERK